MPTPLQPPLGAVQRTASTAAMPPPKSAIPQIIRTISPLPQRPATATSPITTQYDYYHHQQKQEY